MRSFLLLILLCLGGLARAETVNPLLIEYDICSAGYEVYHVNGIFTDLTGARANLTKIVSTYGNAHEKHLVRYTLLHNPTRNLLDLKDSFLQIAHAFPGATYSDWVYAVWTGVFGGTMTAAMVANIAQQIAGDIDKPNPLHDPDLNLLQSEFNKVHRAGARSLAVCHSQGTLYCNELYDRLVKQTTPAAVPPESLGVVFVAAATSSVRGGGAYTTGTNDWVINTVRLIGDKNTLKGNIVNPKIPDTFGHNFITVYFNSLNPDTVKRIKSQISSGLTKLESGPPYVQRKQQLYPHVTVAWYNCGPGSGNPYNCWFHAGGTAAPVLKTAPYVAYWKTGVSATINYTDERVAIDGAGIATAEALAKSLAATCQSLATVEYNKARLGQPAGYIKGCFPYNRAPGPFEGIHADSMAVRTFTSEGYYSMSVSGFVDGVCRII